MKRPPAEDTAILHLLMNACHTNLVEFIELNIATPAALARRNARSTLPLLVRISDRIATNNVAQLDASARNARTMSQPVIPDRVLADEVPAAGR